MNPPQKSFNSLTVFILATNETESLNNTISQIRGLKYFNDINRIIVVVKSITCPAYSEAQKIISANSDKLDIYIQKSDRIELCVSELPPLVETSHFVITAADGEMDINDIDTFICKAKENPCKIICGAKWHKDSTVHGYGKIHEIASRCIGWIISIIFGQKVCDPFSIHQIYPISVYKKLNFNNRKTFGFEYTIKALRNNIEYEEIPTVYKKRTEGATNFNKLKLFKTAITYFLIALKVRFEPKITGQNINNEAIK